jgi:hypothetical protein
LRGASYLILHADSRTAFRLDSRPVDRNLTSSIRVARTCD